MAIVRKGLLHAVLSHLNRLIDRHASIPALHHVKLDADGNALRIEATDLSTTTITATIPCEGRISVCLPARQLAEFVKPDDAADRHTQVELLPEDDQKVTVAVEAALTTLPALPVADFPRRPGDKLAAHDWQGAGTWRAADFSSALGWVSLAVGTDDTRKHLTGILFAKDEVVGVDGHRLHLVRMNGLGGGTPTLLAGRSVAALLRVLPKSGDVAALRAQGCIRFRCATGDVQWEVETQAMAEKFPPYEQVIPNENAAAFQAEVDRAALVRGIARMPKTKDRRHVGVRLTASAIEREFGIRMKEWMEAELPPRGGNEGGSDPNNQGLPVVRAK